MNGSGLGGHRALRLGAEPPVCPGGGLLCTALTAVMDHDLSV